MLESSPGRGIANADGRWIAHHRRNEHGHWQAPPNVGSDRGAPQLSVMRLSTVVYSSNPYRQSVGYFVGLGSAHAAADRRRLLSRLRAGGTSRRLGLGHPSPFAAASAAAPSARKADSRGYLGQRPARLVQWLISKGGREGRKEGATLMCSTRSAT